MLLPVNPDKAIIIMKKMIIHKKQYFIVYISLPKFFQFKIIIETMHPNIPIIEVDAPTATLSLNNAANKLPPIPETKYIIVVLYNPA